MTAKSTICELTKDLFIMWSDYADIMRGPFYDVRWIWNVNWRTGIIFGTLFWRALLQNLRLLAR